ncbi:MAG: thiamine phosphate synthase [Prevotella sp.]|uniref:thiamine phosphate synthase n=1 Tax=Prevotella sp. TaxID=59823 RepID=UPI002A354911|nr:thiamine phosphate synthase [Prevotella sp.]MDD7317250.1 thiamine phosphate synthase [Prevotellaceae bacterium]MDY4019854.1 thiamine phosphate synthase [Prevotella sp.]
MKGMYFISHATARLSHLQGMEAALKGGCRWIQLRMKDADDESYCRTATEVRMLCDHYRARLILDDRAHLVKKTHADGVHLGSMDMPVAEARRLFGEERYIIGATANTTEQAIAAAQAGADYLGCGPFRFTTTKAKLAPILGLEGYRRIITGLRKRGIAIPVFAIGGIREGDISEIFSTGVQGIAVSGAVTGAKNPAEAMRIMVERCAEQWDKFTE